MSWNVNLCSAFLIGLHVSYAHKNISFFQLISQQSTIMTPLPGGYINQALTGPPLPSVASLPIQNGLTTPSITPTSGNFIQILSALIFKSLLFFKNIIIMYHMLQLVISVILNWLLFVMKSIYWDFLKFSKFQRWWWLFVKYWSLWISFINYSLQFQHASLRAWICLWHDVGIALQCPNLLTMKLSFHL